MKHHSVKSHRIRNQTATDDVIAREYSIQTPSESDQVTEYISTSSRLQARLTTNESMFKSMLNKSKQFSSEAKTYSSGFNINQPVTWDSIDNARLSKPSFLNKVAADASTHKQEVT